MTPGWMPYGYRSGETQAEAVHTHVLTYRELESKPFVRGIYTARATWGNKYYEFGPLT